MRFYAQAFWHRWLTPVQAADPFLKARIVRRMRRAVADVIRANGEFRVEGRTGFLAARKA